MAKFANDPGVLELRKFLLQAIRDIQTTHNYSLTDMAERLGFSKAYYSAAMHGQYTVSVDALLAWLGKLGYTVRVEIPAIGRQTTVHERQ